MATAGVHDQSEADVGGTAPHSTPWSRGLARDVHLLGVAFIFGVYFQLSIDGVSVFLPPAAVAAMAVLLRLRSRVDDRSLRRAMVTLMALAAAVAVLGVEAFTSFGRAHHVEAVAFGLVDLGSVVWCGSLCRWCMATRLSGPVRRFRRATLWLAVSTAGSAAGLVMLMARRRPDPELQSSLLMHGSSGHHHGLVTGIVVAVVSVSTLVGWIYMGMAALDLRDELIPEKRKDSYFVLLARKHRLTARERAMADPPPT